MKLIPESDNWRGEKMFKINMISFSFRIGMNDGYLERLGKLDNALMIKNNKVVIKPTKSMITFIVYKSGYVNGIGRVKEENIQKEINNFVEYISKDNKKEHERILE